MAPTRRTAAAWIGLALGLAVSGATSAAEVRVMSSGGLTAAFETLVPDYERASGNTVRLILGPSMGTSPEAIPNRLAGGEYADVVLMVGSALGDLAARGAVDPASRVDVADSRIAMAVKAGAPAPDIATLDAFRRALLAARSVAYSDSASGVYIEREMYAKLGIEAEMRGKSRKIVAERVGNVVARGEAEVGFQQVAELKPIKGITMVGELPEGAQRVTTFSAGIPTSAREKEAARGLVAFLVSAEAREKLVASGLAPVARP